eukprot:TRINITY_DN7570_c0_g1_i2.p1 TRINITY_DN7570_c0_g1~~TRINITY_DN7570_c0_g1_i2.p1  ORF type:complete len:342 (-),score=42.92 TRINITY_DN7570_c0_g1_i2:1262-2287(-)
MTDLAQRMGNTNGKAYTVDVGAHKKDEIFAHVPFFDKTVDLATKVRALVPHESMDRDHQITAFWATDQNNKIIACRSFDGLYCTHETGECTPYKDNLDRILMIPHLDFYLPFSAKLVIPYISCDIHLVWKGAPMAIDLNFCTESKLQKLMQENELLHGVSPLAFNSIRMPPNWAGKNASHVPIVKVFLAPMVRIEVPHEMTDTHWITTIWLKDENNNIMNSCQDLNMQKPHMDFYIPSLDTEFVTVFEHCNLHGVWESETVKVKVKNYCDHTNALIAENMLLHNTPGPFFYNYYPENWMTIAESHIPVVHDSVVGIFGQKYRVTVRHNMTVNHWITAILDR